MTAHVAGSDSGFTQDSQTVLRGRADVETRFGLLVSTQDHAHADRRTLADLSILIFASVGRCYLSP